MSFPTAPGPAACRPYSYCLKSPAFLFDFESDKRVSDLSQHHESLRVALVGCKSRSPFSTHFSRLYPRGKGCILGTGSPTTGCVKVVCAQKFMSGFPSPRPPLRPKSAWRDHHFITTHDPFLERVSSTLLVPLLVPLLHGSCPSSMPTTPRFSISESGFSLTRQLVLAKSRFVSRFQRYHISALPVEVTWAFSAMNTRDSDYVPAHELGSEEHRGPFAGRPNTAAADRRGPSLLKKPTTLLAHRIGSSAVQPGRVLDGGTDRYSASMVLAWNARSRILSRGAAGFVERRTLVQAPETRLEFWVSCGF